MIEPIPSNGHWDLTEDDFGNVSQVWVRDTALLSWPVDFGGRKVNVEGPHVTAFYFDDLTDIKKEDLLICLGVFFAQTRVDNIGMIAEIYGAAAFGPEENVPVLTVDLPDYFRTLRHYLGKYLTDNGFKYDIKWDYAPHVTVDLKTAISPPSHVQLNPLELWWKQDEPVVISEMKQW